ncbi:hypothetical protein Tco_0543069 [Tanacetum coccineum]
MKCQPLNFKGTEGVVGLSQWLEKMESIFHISGCVIENQVKFATYTLLGAALTWWNRLVRTLGHDVAYAMTWEMFNKNCLTNIVPNGEIKNLKNLNCGILRNVGIRKGIQNQGTEARGMVYTLGGGEINQDLDNTEDDITA